MKKLYLMFLLPLLFVGTLSAQISSKAVTGNWSSPGTWVGGVVPGAGDDVIIVNGAVITADVSSTVLSISIGGGTSGKLILANSGVTLATTSTISSTTISLGVSSGATLEVDNGTLNIGNANNERLDYTTGSNIVINGGVVNVASRMTSSSSFGINYTQTGGIFNVNTVENGSSYIYGASFDIEDIDNSSFTMSGGTITIQNAGDGGSGPRDYNNNASNLNITGGTVQVGNVNSGVAQTFYLQGVVPNLLISGTFAHTARLLGDLTVNNTVTINPTSTLALDDGSGTGHVLTINGSTVTNNGVLTGNITGSQMNFFSASPQVYIGSGVLTAPLASMAINGGGGLTINTSLPINFNVARLDMFFGDITTGPSTLVLGTSPSSTGTYNYTYGSIIGKFKRWVAASSGITSFPVGIAGTARQAAINFITAPTTGGSLTAEWVSVAGGSNGLPLTEAAVPVTITNSSSAGFWRVTSGDGLTGGTYIGQFTGSGITTINDYTKLVLLKRVDASSPWTLSGTHITTTGSNSIPVLSRSGLTAFSEFGIGGDATTNVLPITIEYINGTKTTGGNLLNWKISCTNAPSATMTLERSADGRNFKSITVINATAVQCNQPFSYVDAAPLSGINYYRLKSTDPDGFSKYSPIVALLNKDKGFEIVSLLPNFVTTTASLNVTSAVNTKMDISIIDISGKQVSKQTVSLAAGNNVISLNLSNLAAGTYRIVGYGADGQQKTLPFVKQ